MSDKFLGTGNSSNVSNGTTIIFGSSLGALNLDPSEPLKTNSTRQLVSTKLLTTDVLGLQNELNDITNEIDSIKGSIDPTIEPRLTVVEDNTDGISVNTAGETEFTRSIKFNDINNAAVNFPAQTGQSFSGVVQINTNTIALKSTNLLLEGNVTLNGNQIPSENIVNSNTQRIVDLENFEQIAKVELSNLENVTSDMTKIPIGTQFSDSLVVTGSIICQGNSFINNGNYLRLSNSDNTSNLNILGKSLLNGNGVLFENGTIELGNNGSSYIMPNVIGTNGQILSVKNGTNELEFIDNTPVVDPVIGELVEKTQFITVQPINPGTPTTTKIDSEVLVNGNAVIENGNLIISRGLLRVGNPNGFSEITSENSDIKINRLKIGSNAYLMPLTAGNQGDRIEMGVNNELQFVPAVVGLRLSEYSRFNNNNTSVIFEDDFIRITWTNNEAQASYQLKQTPNGGTFGPYVDVSAVLLNGGGAVLNNTDNQAILNQKQYFYGQTIQNQFNHQNYGDQLKATLCSEVVDNNFPFYRIEINTGLIGAQGFGSIVIERY